MEYRLGLDLGTNSIGAVALSLLRDDSDKHYVPNDIIWHRGHIFSEPLTNTQAGLVPKTAERREARQKRRQLQRRARRIKKIFHLAPLLGLIKEDVKHINKHIILDDGTKIPRLAYMRAKAAKEKVELNDLLQIFSRLAKKRGYNGGFKTRSKKEDKGSVEKGSDQLDEELANRTLGQYLLEERLVNGKPTRLKINHCYNNEVDLYALREHLEAEFEKIWDTQSKYHKTILCSKAVCTIHGKHNHYGEELSKKEIFRIAIFDQRRLKPFNDKIGLCELESNLPRSSKVQMSAQAFRIEKVIADLRYGQGEKKLPLNPDQKNILRDLLNMHVEVKFESIYESFRKADCALPEGKKFSIETAKKESLKGNTTIAGFKTLKLWDDWSALDEITQVQIINFWSELGSPELLFDDDWENKFLTWNKNPEKRKPRKFTEPFREFINKLRKHEEFDRLSKIKHFEGNRAAYSIKALNILTKYMREHNCDEDVSRTGCYPNHNNRENDNHEKLRPLKSTGNAVVDVALNQLQIVVNDCIDNLGSPPTEIIVEMSRDIKNGVATRNEIANKNRQREKQRKKAAKDITDNFGEAATLTNIRKYELWNEQEHHCPYCNTLIGCHQVLDGSKTNYEHIIPRSKSSVGSKRSEIILAHRTCNSAKGNNLPLLAPKFINDKQSIRAITEMAKRLEKKGKKSRNPGLLRKAQLLRLDDAEGLADDDSVSGFSDWQLHDSSWIAKVARDWLTSIVEKPSQVSTTTGGLTAYMRRHLGLDTVIPELRFQEGKSVLIKGDRGDKEKFLSKEEFTQYKSFYNGHPWQDKIKDLPPPLDKRIDHRHHIIDALIIALSEPKYVRRATKLHQHYYDKALKEGKVKHRVIQNNMRKAIGHELQNFKAREKALQFLNQKTVSITHRPDHNIAGGFYKDSSYNRVADDTGKLRLVISKPLEELAVKANIDETIKKLKSIVSKKVREHILNEFDKRISNGNTPEAALAEPVFQDWYGEKKQIMTVKTYYDSSAEKADKIIFKGKRNIGYKFLIPELYAYFSLYFTSEGKIDKKLSTLVSLKEALNEPSELKPNEWRYYKGDTLQNLDTGERFIIYSFKATAGGTILMGHLTEARPEKKLKKTDGRQTKTYTQLAPYKPIR